MSRFRIFKVPQHQRFEYRPRYWDPEKERQEAFKDRIKKIQGQGVESTKARISSNLRTGYGGDARLRTKLIGRSNFRIIAILAGLVILSYFLLEKYLPYLEDYLGN